MCVCVWRGAGGMMGTPEFVDKLDRIWIVWGPPLAPGIQNEGSLVGDLALQLVGPDANSW